MLRITSRLARLKPWLGPGVALLMLVTPPPASLGPAGWRVAAVALWMATWWITETVPLAVTALLPLALFPLLGVAPIHTVAAPFAHPLIVLFMGGFILAIALTRWGVHHRLAYAVLSRVGTSPRRLLAGVMAITAALSMWINNTSTTMMMMPLCASIIDLAAGHPDPDDTPARPGFAVALLLGLAYAANIGGTGTLIGTAPNALLAAFLASRYQIDLSFASWLILGLPLVVVGVTLTFATLLLLCHIPRHAHLSLDALMASRDDIGPLRPAEQRVLAVFATVALAWITRPLLQPWLPNLSDAGIAMVGAISLFVIPAGDADQRLLSWDALRDLPWGLLLLFGGGLSLAAAIQTTGLATWLGEGLDVFGHIPLPLLIALVLTLMVSLTEMTSNTATTATFLPVLAALADRLHLDPSLLLIPAALGASCAFMLPIATPPNAIVYSHPALHMRPMMRTGLWLNLLFVLLITLLTLLLVPWVG